MSRTWDKEAQQHAAKYAHDAGYKNHPDGIRPELGIGPSAYQNEHHNQAKQPPDTLNPWLSVLIKFRVIFAVPAKKSHLMGIFLFSSLPH